MKYIDPLDNIDEVTEYINNTDFSLRSNIEIIPTEDKPITGIRKRMILTDIQKVNSQYGKLLSLFMNKDKARFYDNKQLLIDLLESTIEKAFIEGQRTGTKHIEYIKGNEVYGKGEVYKKRSDNYVGD